VRSLLLAAGARRLPAPITVRVPTAAAGSETPETYLGTERGENFVAPLRPGTRDYTDTWPGGPPLDEFALRGLWTVGAQSATPAASGAAIDARVRAARVYLVLTSTDNDPRTVRVRLDGRPIAAADAGADVLEPGGRVRVRNQRLYELVALPGGRAGDHRLEVDVPPGVSAYDFTFG
jgi:hypothetical protein